MRRTLQHPARAVPIAFLIAISAGTVLLMLPVSRQGPGGAPLLTALFTTTSAVCVTGLSIVDTPTYWSSFGQAVILGEIQVGGLGIVTLATMLGLLVSRRLGLSRRLMAQAENRSVTLGSVRGILGRVALTLLVCETVVAVALTARFWLGYRYPFGKAVWHGVFHAVSAFNDAGFALYSDNMVRFVGDWWVCLPLIAAVVVASLGFPVLFELLRELRRPATWTVHTRLTVMGTVVLLAVGFVAVLAFEWTNAGTLGPLGVADKTLAALFQSAMPRTAGFNSVDYAQMQTETVAVTDVLMFIGGGSAGTAGGIKVTTFFLLAYVIWSEVRAESDVVVGRRRIAESAQRQAVSVALLGVAVVAVGTLLLLLLTDLPLDRALFETTSAFATVGLSTGVTATLPPAAQVVLVMLMFVGRVGTVAVASAMALAERPRRYRYPEEQPIVG
ncbi:MAG TPA: potassium transporter TrkG [Micromonosporaceae bacterium]|nr:potassium transporter TrkG [Micromonosporaceae bacterium]